LSDSNLVVYFSGAGTFLKRVFKLLNKAFVWAENCQACATVQHPEIFSRRGIGPLTEILPGGTENLPGSLLRGLFSLKKFLDLLKVFD